MVRPLVVAAVLGVTTLAASRAAAVLPDTTSPAPSIVDVEAAVTRTSFGSVRWSRVTVAGTPRVLWLVPARPGAAVDWAPDAWLDSLDSASALRISTPCTVTEGPMWDVPGPWHRTGARRWPTAITSHATEASLREHAGQRGFAISSELGARITDLYAGGWVTVTLELEVGQAPVSSPTLRISDDGAPLLPVALTTGASNETRATVFVMSDRPTTISGAVELDPKTLTWSSQGTDYEARRSALLGAAPVSWLRESSSHEVVFDGAALEGGVRTPALASTYFRHAVGLAGLECAETARTAARSLSTVGRTCAPGLVLRVPGGTECAAASGGNLPPQIFTCGEAQDLALALGGIAPGSATVTRLVGRVAPATLGHDDALVSSSAPRSLTVTAGASAACPASTEPAPTAAPAPSPSEPRLTMPPAPSGRAERIESSDSGEGCGAFVGAATAYEEDYEETSGEGCAADDDGSYDDGSWIPDDEGDGEDAPTEYDDTTDEEEADDEDDEDDEGWEDVDWDDDSESASLRKKTTTLRAPKKRSASPVSRFALLLGALALPLRRRRRPDDQR